MRKNNHKSKQLLQKKNRNKFGWIAVLLCWAALAGVLTFLQRNSQAQSPSAIMSVNPTSGTYTVGNQINVAVRVTATTDYNYAGVYVTYNESTMQYLGTTFGSSFNGTPNTLATGSNSTYGGFVAIADFRQSGTGGLKGTHTLATIRFKVIRAGTGKANLVSPIVRNRPNTNYTVHAVQGAYTFKNPPPVDVCPNISGTQTTVPSGYTKNSAGNCVKKSTPAPDVCPNISGRQTKVPSGYAKNSAGNCVRKPTPAPAPTPTAPIRPSSDTNAPVTKGSIKLTGLKITNINYRTARITWKTNQNASTVVEYGTSKENLTQRKTAKTGSSHRIDFTASDDLLAGTTYYIKVTSKNGSQTASATGEFTTKPVPVIITVTDTDNKPVEEAAVSIGEVVGVTDEKGEVQLALPSGYQLIIARKGDLYREIDTQILVPTDSDAPKQRVTLNLGTFKVDEAAKTASEEAKKTNGSASWLWSFLVVPLLLAGVVFIVLILRKRKEKNDYIGGDILEAENYNVQTSANMPPSMPTPQTDQTLPPIDSASPPRYSSLPELVGRYASDQATQRSSPPTEPESIQQSPWAPPPHAPQHTSLKDMVQVPNLESSQPSEQNINEDLPISPVSPPPGVPPVAPTQHRLPDSENNDQDTSLTIEH